MEGFYILPMHRLINCLCLWAEFYTCSPTKKVRESEENTQKNSSSDNEYYAEVDHSLGLQYQVSEPANYNTSTTSSRYPVPTNPNTYWSPPCTTEELCELCGRGRGKTKREKLHSHRPFGTKTRSLQSRFQWKIEKNQKQ